MYSYKIDSNLTLEQAKEFERQYFGGARISVNDSQFAWALAHYLMRIKQDLADRVAYDIGVYVGPSSHLLYETRHSGLQLTTDPEQGQLCFESTSIPKKDSCL